MAFDTLALGETRVMLEAPIALPEFGIDDFSWATCHNPKCPNFGVPYDPDDPDYPNFISDRHYAMLSRTDGAGRCRYCNGHFSAKPNRALRPIARYFLSLSLPFADCSNPDCNNHGVNVFENYSDTGSGIFRHYRIEKENAVRCCLCDKWIRLGEPWHLPRNDETVDSVWRLTDYILVGAKKRRVLVRLGMRSQTYLNRVRKIGRRVKDYQAFLNAHLLSPTVLSRLDVGPVARVYTDILTATLRRRGKVARYRRMRFIVSVLGLKGTHFILAAHPFFLPRKFAGPKADEPFLDPRGQPLPDFKARWDCLEHPVHNAPAGLDPRKIRERQADVSRYDQGFYIDAPYAITAHFLVVRKMLSRFKRICFYFDGDRTMIQSAMVALSGAIKSGQVDAVVSRRSDSKSSRQPRSKSAHSTPLRNMGRIGSKERLDWLERCWEAAEKEVWQKIAGTDPPPGGQHDIVAEFPEKAAQLYYPASFTAFREASEWAWMRFPDLYYAKQQFRTLWLTRRAGKTFEDAKQFLLYSTIQPVDSAMQSMRRRVRSLDRPDSGSSKVGGVRSMIERYYDPEIVLSELNVHTLDLNYFITQPDQKIIPADTLKLTPMPTPVLDPADAAVQFRFGVSHAKTISQWLRQ